MLEHSLRRLIWLPIVHAQADLGTMGETVRQLHQHHGGHAPWEQHVQAVEGMWTDIRRQLEGLHLEPEHVRLYQDGLPDCGHELPIVQDLARSGSRNHQILLELIERGAQLVGTESPDLLLEEYDLAGQVLEALRCNRPDRLRRLQQRGQTLLEERDRFIAGRIEQTLGAGETGLLFLGLLHSLDGRLPRDIEAIRLSPAGPRGEERGRAALPKQRRPSQ